MNFNISKPFFLVLMSFRSFFLYPGCTESAYESHPNGSYSDCHIWNMLGYRLRTPRNGSCCLLQIQPGSDSRGSRHDHV